ncbi:MAG: helix-turn-helix transcriptional regulator [Planctomycetes bacterium]|nr:helix-turn-helix transcriptional regulator [Planctomycetota bacterium]MBI3847136.1 helix-turn-helix transcriptional regulator [Planctomycetota bacterium]
MAKASRGRKGRGAPALHENVAQLRALAHPLRLRLIELFGEAPRTTMQVAALLGQPPTRLYHHVNALERAGLLRLKETRPNRGTIEKWYETDLDHIRRSARSLMKRGRPTPESITGVVQLVLDQARREVTAALAEPPGNRSVVAVRVVTIAKRAQIKKVRARLLALTRQVQRDCGGEPASMPRSGVIASRSSSAHHKAVSATPANQERWAITITFAPVWPRASK